METFVDSCGGFMGIYGIIVLLLLGATFYGLSKDRMEVVEQCKKCLLINLRVCLMVRERSFIRQFKIRRTRRRSQLCPHQMRLIRLVLC